MSWVLHCMARHAVVCLCIGVFAVASSGGAYGVDMHESCWDLRGLMQKGAFARLRRALHDSPAHHVTYAVRPSPLATPCSVDFVTVSTALCRAGVCEDVRASGCAPRGM
jgi:hypothetical protein